MKKSNPPFLNKPIQIIGHMLIFENATVNNAKFMHIKEDIKNGIFRTLSRKDTNILFLAALRVFQHKFFKNKV
jgi:hypothetical protein